MSFSIRKWGKPAIALLIVIVMLFSFAEAFAAYTINGVTYDRPIPGVTRDKNTGTIKDSSGKNVGNDKPAGSGSGSGGSGSGGGSGGSGSSGGGSGGGGSSSSYNYSGSSSSSSYNYNGVTYDRPIPGATRDTQTGQVSIGGQKVETTVEAWNISNMRLSNGDNYGTSYQTSTTYDTNGNKVAFSAELSVRTQQENKITGAQDGGVFSNAIKKNKDGTSEESVVKINYESASDITTFISTITQTRADGESVTSDYIDNFDGDVLRLVKVRGTQDDNEDLIGELELETENDYSASQIRNVLGLPDQYLPFGTSGEAFEGQKSTYYEIDELTGEIILKTSYIDNNGDVLYYEMVYNPDGIIKRQTIIATDGETKTQEEIFDTEKWIAGEMEASDYESKLGHWGIDYGKITTTAATSGSSTTTRSVTEEVPATPPTPGDGGGYSSAYSVTANVKSPAGKVYVTDKPSDAAIYGNSKTWTYSGSTVKKLDIVPDVGYRIKDVQINGVSQGAVPQVAVQASSSGVLVNVWFERISHTVTATYGKNGIISPSGIIKVYDGESQTISFTPDKNCSVAFVVVDGQIIENPGSQYIFENVKEDHTIHVEFSDANSTHFKFIYATSGEGGSLSIEGCIPVNPGNSQDIEIIPDDGFEVDKIIVDGELREASTHFRFEAVTTHHTIHVTFKEKAARTSFVVTATAGAGGKINPNGMTTVASGGSMTLKITPDEGYIVGNVYVNGQSVGIVSELNLTKIFDDQTVYATFINTKANGADLVVADITPDRVYAGMKAMSFVRIMNMGSVAANNTEVKFSVNGQTYTEKITKTIYPGSYYDILFKWPAPVTAGTITAQAQVNGNNAVQETNKANNSLSKDLTVAPMFPEARDDEDPGIINPAAYSIPSDNPVADVTWEQNGEMYRALVGMQVDPSAEGLKSGYGFETTATVQIITNSPHLSVEDLKVIVRLPEFGYAKCKTLEEDTSKRTDTTEDGVRTITCTYRFAVNTTSKIGARKWYVPVSWPDMYNYKLHTHVYGIATPAGYIEVSQNSSILINSNMYTDDSLGRG